MLSILGLVSIGRDCCWNELHEDPIKAKNNTEIYHTKSCKVSVLSGGNLEQYFTWNKKKNEVGKNPKTSFCFLDVVVCLFVCFQLLNKCIIRLKKSLFYRGKKKKRMNVCFLGYVFQYAYILPQKRPHVVNLPSSAKLTLPVSLSAVLLVFRQQRVNHCLNYGQYITSLLFFQLF